MPTITSEASDPGPRCTCSVRSVPSAPAVTWNASANPGSSKSSFGTRSSDPKSVAGGSTGAELSTVTVTASDVVSLPAASRATAVSTCVPSAAVVESHVTEYGAVVSAAPSSMPSSWKPTLVTLTSSVADATTLTAPETVEPAPGVSIPMDGAAVSGCAGSAGVTAR